MARRLQLQFEVSDNLLVGYFFEQAVERRLTRVLAEISPASAKLEGADSAARSKQPRERAPSSRRTFRFRSVQLLLTHGETRTGKTKALRALD